MRLDLEIAPFWRIVKGAPDYVRRLGIWRFPGKSLAGLRPSALGLDALRLWRPLAAGAAAVSGIAGRLPDSCETVLRCKTTPLLRSLSLGFGCAFGASHQNEGGLAVAGARQTVSPVTGRVAWALHFLPRSWGCVGHSRNARIARPLSLAFRALGRAPCSRIPLPVRWTLTGALHAAFSAFAGRSARQCSWPPLRRACRPFRGYGRASASMLWASNCHRPAAPARSRSFAGKSFCGNEKHPARGGVWEAGLSQSGA